MSKPKRCVLAYSGGLDTSVSIRWLQERLGYEVITCTADIGETKNIEEVTDRALRTGAVAAIRPSRSCKPSVRWHLWPRKN